MSGKAERRKTAADPEAVHPEVLTGDEPKYLRRQRPLEIKRRRFSHKARDVYKRVFLGVAGLFAAACLVYAGLNFLFASRRMALVDMRQVEIEGNRFVTREMITELFLDDQGSSVLRIPLADRRAAIEQIPWVEHAEVQRVLPNRIRVRLSERTPVAFLRLGSDLALVDGHGVILDRPREATFRFPVVSGLAESQPLEERAARMRMFQHFIKEVEAARPGAAASVSEVDLRDARDLRAAIEVPASSGAAAPVLVHFGDADFLRKYSIFVRDIGQWQRSVGRVESVDLRFDRQVVVNPEQRPVGAPPAGPQAQPQKGPAKGEARPVAAARN